MTKKVTLFFHKSFHEYLSTELPDLEYSAGYQQAISVYGDVLALGMDPYAIGLDVGVRLEEMFKGDSKYSGEVQLLSDVFKISYRMEAMIGRKGPTIILEITGYLKGQKVPWVMYKFSFSNDKTQGGCLSARMIMDRQILRRRQKEMLEEIDPA